MTSAPHWILLRGLARESAHWGGFPALLRRQLADASVTVTALDLPGNGRLNGLTSPARIAPMTQWCRDEVRRLGLAPPYRLLAISMGAMVAIDWMRIEPEAIDGCVLINTSLRPFDPWWRRLRPSSCGALLSLVWPAASAERYEATILRLTSRNPEAAARAIGAWVRLRRERPVSGRNALRQLLAAARFSAPVEPPAARLLVLASLRDGLVDVRCSLQLAQRWRAEIAVHPQAGHDLPLDDGSWVAERVARWAVAPASDAAAAGERG